MWFGFLGFKVVNYYKPSGESIYLDRAYQQKVGVREYYFGIYLKDIRIGFLKRITMKTDTGYKIYEEGVMLMSFLGEKKELQISLYGDMDNESRLNAFTFQIVSNRETTHVKGVMEKPGLSLTVMSGGQQTRQIINVREKPLIPSSLPDYIVKGGYETQKTLRVPVFDPSAMANYEAEISLLGWESIVIEGEKIRAFHIKTAFKGIEIHGWIDESGAIVKEVSPVGLTVLKEREQEDQKADYMNVETLSSVETTGTVKDQNNARFMTMRIDTKPELRAVIGKYNNLNGNILENERGNLSRIHLDPQNYRAPSVFIDSNDKNIRATAIMATRGSGTEREKVRSIGRWVNANMKKIPTFSIPLASDVLKKRVGDCNEHAVLFAALARAAGIPAAIASGVVYNKGRFFYHAWNLVYIDGKWTDLDSTFGQFPADPTHIIMAVGDISDGIEVMQFVRNLKIHIMEEK